MNPTDLAPQPPVLSRKHAPNGTAALLTALSLLIFLPFVNGAHRVLITEVMSANQRTVVDEDRQASDWIELLNAGSQPVQLAGWKLTADPKQAKTWTFPELAVKPGEHILVFASGKNRAVAGKELHTDFKLDADGEYLALLGPDGKTVVQEFKPRLPAMRMDVSYGIPLSMETSRILAADSTKQIRVPWAEMGEAWRQPTIPMEGWFSAKGGIGFDSGTNFARFLGTDSSAMMKGRSPGLLVRAPFLVKPGEVDRMVLRMFYDDGFVAWINGREVARRNAPAQLVWNSSAPGPRESATAVTWKESFESAEPDFVLANGDASARARVAVAAPDTNRFLRLVNGRVPEQINSVSFPQALPAAPKSLKVEFDYRVKGGSGSPTDLYLVLIPVKDFDVRGPGADVQVFRGGADLELRKGLAVRLSTQPSRKQVEATIHWDGAQMGRFTSDESSLIWRFYHRAFLTVDFTEEGAVVALNVKTDSRGGTGKEAVVLQRTLIQGAQPYPARLQIAARTTSSLTTVDLDEMQASWVPAAGSLAEDFDLTPFVSDLKPGTNLLSIFALNRSSDDGDFLVLPELYGYAARLQTSSPRFFAPASPLSANQEGGLEAPYPAPVITPKARAAQGETKVTLSASGTGAVVRYTLDGKEPGEGSQVYSEPISVSTTTVIKARTFAPGRLASDSSMAMYTELGEDVAGFSSNIPLIVLNTRGSARYDSRKTALTAAFFDPGKDRADLKAEPTTVIRGDFNVRGFSSTRYPKRSYTLRLRDDYAEKLKAPLFGMPKDSDWVLYAPYPDKTLIRDVLAYELFAKMGNYATRTRFVELFVNRSGGALTWRDYQGVYVLIEKIKRGKNRVDIKELGPADNAGDALTGGYIFKRDHSNNEGPTFHSRGGEFFLVEPDPEDVTPQQREYIERHWRELERAVFGKSWLDPKRGYRSYIDMKSFIDQHWLIEMSKNIDGFRYSVIFSKDRGGKVKLEPPWDWNLSFGNANYLDGDSPRGWYTEQLRDTEISWHRRFSDDPEYMKELTERWWQLRKGPFATDTLMKRIDEMAALLNEAQARNFKRWRIMGDHVHPNAFVGDTYAEEINYMKRWTRERLKWIDSQMPAASAAR